MLILAEDNNTLDYFISYKKKIIYWVIKNMIVGSIKET